VTETTVAKQAQHGFARFGIAAKRASLVAALAALIALACWAERQDHFTAIALDGDASWFANYEPNGEMQDLDIFFHGIGNSVRNAQRADIIFLGASRPLFALDWQIFEDFAQRHHVAMFNMAFAGVVSAEFSSAIIHKWHLRPKLWVVDVLGIDTPANSFFYGLSQEGSSRLPWTGAIRELMGYNRLNAYVNVMRRNVVWRFKHVIGAPSWSFYRSTTSGNWYVDKFPPRLIPNPMITAPGKQTCSASAEEIAAARKFVEEIGGSVVLTQIPSSDSCDARVRDLAAAISATAFTVEDRTLFSTFDGGGHLDSPSAKKYSKAFFAWLEQQQVFRMLRLMEQAATGSP
jgi:hypothetical protein